MTEILGAKSKSPRPRVLYVMHVDWRWIKQRPHFLAEEIRSSSIKILVLYVPSLRRYRLPKNPSRIRRLPLLLVPRWTDGRARLWNRTVGKLVLGVVGLFFRPTVTWLTFPALYELLPKSLRRHPVLYDAMDVARGFYTDSRAKAIIQMRERETVKGASIITCSSPYIKEHITGTYGVQDNRIRVVRNAYDSRRLWEVPKRVVRSADEYRITYVGTISRWFDFNTLEYALRKLPQLQVNLYGPADRPIPRVARLVHRGVLPHHLVHQVARETDAFVMPFIVTELIRGVDPVKVYEYLAMRRPVVCPWYEGLAAFGQLINFYRSSPDFVRVLVDLIEGRGTVVPSDALKQFLALNDWRARAGVVGGLLIEQSN